jgi:vitamin B12/bleomycin/antimicrobial peptide transport system ATP-binding/permease protein
VTHWIGRRLIPLDFEQERREADFRFALVRLRENAEAVAMLGGEVSEKLELRTRFLAIMQNWYRLMRRQQFVGLFTGSYRRFSLYFPYFAMSPLFFGGTMQLGAFMQSGSAFNEVRDAFSYFISSYLKIAELSAIVQRLAQFEAAIIVARSPALSDAQIVATSPEVLRVERLVVNTPDMTSIAALNELKVAAGEAVMIMGASGAGKTSLLRAFAGIWPHVTGSARISATRVLALPQLPYIPLGSLRRALCYPLETDMRSDAELESALLEVGLGELSGSLDQSAAWDKTLSVGEKQRLSLARAILFQPELLLLDEATAALDEPSEIELHQRIRRRLPRATIVAVSHRPALARVYDRTINIEAVSLNR